MCVAHTILFYKPIHTGNGNNVRTHLINLFIKLNSLHKSSYEVLQIEKKIFWDGT